MAAAGQWWPITNVAPGAAPLLQAPSLRPTTRPATYGALVDVMAQRLVYQALAADCRAAVLAFMGRAASDPVGTNDAFWNWRFPYLVKLILDSVYHAMR
jgi:hypothetical protein